ncbi:FirrV-1-B15 [Feldmannia irregularis virus a]|uniref:FirrV-1-B15 n=1 Tax=Feldmannia irregularis virus a TaxID=231992 RepID=Q6XM21_9PHYC|nr:FirrV-1-B15 [Feldmannia irregularis virus a]AAR26890.1 FirrV-1-B15 [Feldmannia irregularis virus a]
MDAPTVVLAGLVIVLVVFMLTKNGKHKRDKKPPAPAPSAPTEAELGSRQRLGGSRLKGIDCDNVALDSPDFARCATTLGARRPNPRLKGEAFPFTEKSGPLEANALQRKIQSVSAQNRQGGVPLNKAFLGAAVSPSSRSAGASNEMEMATNKLEDVNEVSTYAGGNLNLLNPF